MQTQTVLVPVSIATAALLDRLKCAKDDTFDSVIRRHCEATAKAATVTTNAVQTPASYASGRNRHRFELLGEAQFGDTKKEVLVGVIRRLAQLDTNFLPRLSMEGGRIRRHVARTRVDLYPHRSDLSAYTAEIVPGWYVGTNYSEVDIQRILKDACRVAGLVWGQDLVIQFAGAK